MPRRKQIDGQLSLDFSAMPEEKIVQKNKKIQEKERGKADGEKKEVKAC